MYYTKRSEAEGYLLDVLRDGPQPSIAVMQAAAQAGIRPATLRWAREHLGIVSIKWGGRFGGGKQCWLWRLPAPEDIHHGTEGAEDDLPQAVRTAHSSHHPAMGDPDLDFDSADTAALDHALEEESEELFDGFDLDLTLEDLGLDQI
jgi:hypothetical protein